MSTNKVIAFGGLGISLGLAAIVAALAITGEGDHKASAATLATDISSELLHGTTGASPGLPKGLVAQVNYSPAEGPWKVAPTALVNAMVATGEHGSYWAKKDLMVPANGFYTYYTQDTKRPSWYEFEIFATNAALKTHPGMFDEGGWGIAELTADRWLIGDYNFHQGLYPNDLQVGSNPRPPAAVYADFETTNPVDLPPSTSTKPQAVPTPPTTTPPTTTPPTTISPQVQQTVGRIKAETFLTTWSVWLANNYAPGNGPGTQTNDEVWAAWVGFRNSPDYDFVTQESQEILQDEVVQGMTYAQIAKVIGSEISAQAEADVANAITSWPPDAFKYGMVGPYRYNNGQVEINPNAQPYDLLYMDILGDEGASQGAGS